MTKGRVLLVEDEPGIRLGIRRFLESKGFEVGEAETCRGAVGAFVARPADAVLLDNLLPDGNGIDLPTRLRRSRGMDSPPRARLRPEERSEIRTSRPGSKLQGPADGPWAGSNPGPYRDSVRLARLLLRAGSACSIAF